MPWISVTTESKREHIKGSETKKENVMKRTMLLLMMCALTLSVFAQPTITQKGVAYRYNGKKARTPLGNVSVTCTSANATVLSNVQDGSFSLLLKDRRLGDRMGLVTVKKREMMLH